MPSAALECVVCVSCAREREREMGATAPCPVLFAAISTPKALARPSRSVVIDHSLDTWPHSTRHTSLTTILPAQYHPATLAAHHLAAHDCTPRMHLSADKRMARTAPHPAALHATARVSSESGSSWLDQS